MGNNARSEATQRVVDHLNASHTFAKSGLRAGGVCGGSFRLFLACREDIQVSWSCNRRQGRPGMQCVLASHDRGAWHSWLRVGREWALTETQIAQLVRKTGALITDLLLLERERKASRERRNRNACQCAVNDGLEWNHEEDCPARNEASDD